MFLTQKAKIFCLFENNIIIDASKYVIKTASKYFANFLDLYCLSAIERTRVFRVAERRNKILRDGEYKLDA